MTSTSIPNEVARILRNAGIKEPPIPIAKLDHRLGAQIRYEPSRCQLAGMLYKVHRPAIIGVNSLQSGTRQRFTVAHELGHLILHNVDDLHIDRHFRIGGHDGAGTSAIHVKENEASRFATELLIPAFMLGHEGLESGMDFEYDGKIDRLAKRYEVSFQLMLMRLISLGYTSMSPNSLVEDVASNV